MHFINNQKCNNSFKKLNIISQNVPAIIKSHAHICNSYACNIIYSICLQYFEIGHVTYINMQHMFLYLWNPNPKYVIWM